MTAIGPIARWKPGCKIRLQIRVENFKDDVPVETNVVVDLDEGEFDEFGNFIDPDNPTVDLDEGQFDIFGNFIDSDNPVVDLDGGDFDAFGKAVVAGTGSESFGLAQEHLSDQSFKSIGFDIVPYTVTVERNSYRKADECKITFPLRLLPFDPRLIRSATVQVFGGVIDPTTWSDAMESQDQAILLDDTQRDGSTNEIFRGFVDDWEMDLSERDTISITARDLTQFFIDAELPKNSLRNIPKATTLDETLRLLIFGDGLSTENTKRPGLAGVRGIVVTNETGGTLPKLDQIKPPNWFDSKGTVKKGRKRGKRNVQKMTYWDMMTDLCVSSGFICYVRPGIKPIVDSTGRAVPVSAEVVISNPRTYYSKSVNAGDLIVDQKTVRTFYHGINTNNVTIKRNYTGTTIPSVIEVRTFDTATGKEFSSRFPKKKKNNRPSVSGTGDREEVQVFILRSSGGDMIQQMLDGAARSIYEQLARGEVELTIRTKVLSALPYNINPQEVPQNPNGSEIPPSMDADMLRIVAGEPILLSIDKADIDEGKVSQHMVFSNSTSARKRESMIRDGIRPDVAEQIALAYESQFIQSEFRSQKISMTFDFKTGWEFEVSLVNFIDIRNSAEAGDPAPRAIPVVEEIEPAIVETGTTRRRRRQRVVFEDGLDVVSEQRIVFEEETVFGDSNIDLSGLEGFSL